MLPVIFSTWFLRRLFLVLLILTLVLFTMTFFRNMSAGPEVFEIAEGASQKNKVGLYDSLTHLLKTFSQDEAEFDSRFGVNNTKFHEVLRSRASSRHIIYLSSVDSGYMDLAFNLYYSSFKKHGIDNYLFVGSDSNVCQTMLAYDIACFDYIHDKDANTSSSYFSLAFKRKTHLKTKIILEALKIGLKVIITDVDIVFLRDPTPLLNCADCDIEISSDEVEGNSGFYMARPTTNCIKLHSDAWRQGLAKPEISNQKAIDRTMERMHKQGQIKVRNLNTEIFANGVVFFEKGHRMFKGDNPSGDCAIVHNNWIVSSQAKIYRFKEYGLWASDVGNYFSDEQRKYLIFGLPVDFGGHDTPAQELQSLRTALVLADMFNRTLIMPQFHCYGCTYHGICDHKGARCMFGTFYRIDNFDKSFRNKYRESVFLSSRLVPRAVQESKSQTYLISSDVSRLLMPDLPSYVSVLSPKNATRGPTVEELHNWFSNETSSILMFHSLYNPIDIDANYTAMHPVVSQVRTAFTKANYRQL